MTRLILATAASQAVLLGLALHAATRGDDGLALGMAFAALCCALIAAVEWAAPQRRDL